MARAISAGTGCGGGTTTSSSPTCGAGSASPSSERSIATASGPSSTLFSGLPHPHHFIVPAECSAAPPLPPGLWLLMPGVLVFDSAAGGSVATHARLRLRRRRVRGHSCVLTYEGALDSIQGLLQAP